MNPSEKIWINGQIKLSSESLMFPFSQGLNYGAAIYEGIRFYDTDFGPAIFRLHEHLDRLFYSASVLKMTLHYSKNDLKNAMLDVIKINGLESGYLRPLAFYSEPKMGINIFNSEITVIMPAWPWTEGISEKPVNLKISKYEKTSHKAIDVKAKIAGYYANNLLGFIDAREAGYDGPIFLDSDGFIAEGAVNNIFIIKNGIIYTPTPRNILPGITRDSIIKIAGDLNLEIKECDMKPDFLADADEVFLTGTGIELDAVKNIEGYFENKNERWPITDELSKYFYKITHGRIEKYKKWLTPANTL